MNDQSAEAPKVLAENGVPKSSRNFDIDLSPTMSSSNFLLHAAVKALANTVSGNLIGFEVSSPRAGETDRRTFQSLFDDLKKSGVDPDLFDRLLSNELDRNLKKQFGAAFFIATLLFTAASYGVVILNGIYKWGISEAAITTLIVETPIQFIGLLYIIARNLFPQSGQRQLGQPTKRGGRPAKAEEATHDEV